MSRLSWKSIDEGEEGPLVFILLLFRQLLRAREGLCKLSIGRCVPPLSYLPGLESSRPGLDKHSALMSFIPLFVAYLLTCMTPRDSDSTPPSPPSSLCTALFPPAATLLFVLFPCVFSSSLARFWHPPPPPPLSLSSLSLSLTFSLSTRVI